jgi:DNA polymerase-1
MYWWDWEKWKEEQESFTEQFWEEYRQYHKGTNDEIAQMVSRHFKVASKWDRMALNGPTQGTGACILKDAVTQLFNWVIQNDLFGKVKFCAFVHDEICVEFPKEMEEFPKMLEKLMQESAAKFCKSLPIPAEAAVGEYWIH